MCESQLMLDELEKLRTAWSFLVPRERLYMEQTLPQIACSNAQCTETCVVKTLRNFALWSVTISRQQIGLVRALKWYMGAIQEDLP